MSNDLKKAIEAIQNKRNNTLDNVSYSHQVDVKKGDVNEHVIERSNFKSNAKIEDMRLDDLVYLKNEISGEIESINEEKSLERELNNRDYNKLERLDKEQDKLIIKRQNINKRIEILETQKKAQQEVKRIKKRKEMAEERAPINLYYILAVIFAHVLVVIKFEIKAWPIHIIMFFISTYLILYFYNSYRRPNGTPCANCGDFLTISKIETQFVRSYTTTKQRSLHQRETNKSVWKDVIVTIDVYQDTFKCASCGDLTYETREQEIGMAGV